MIERAEIPPDDADLDWDIVKIPANGTLDCWTACPVWPAWVHWIDSAKRNAPCLRRLTKGCLKCIHCERRLGAKLIGYQPVYDRDERKLVVVVSKRTARDLDGLLTGTPIRLKRGSGPKTRLRLLKQDNTPSMRGKDDTLRNRKAVNIAPWIVHLWADIRLKKHLGIMPDEFEAAAQDDDADHLHDATASPRLDLSFPFADEEEG